MSKAFTPDILKTSPRAFASRVKKVIHRRNGSCKVSAIKAANVERFYSEKQIRAALEGEYRECMKCGKVRP